MTCKCDRPQECPHCMIDVPYKPSPHGAVFVLLLLVGAALLAWAMYVCTCNTEKSSLPKPTTTKDELFRNWNND